MNPFGQQSCQMQFLEYVLVIVACLAIGPDSNGDPCFEHRHDVGQAAGQLEVAGRVVGDPDTALGHDNALLLCDMNAVRSQHSRIQNTVLQQYLYRRQAKQIVRVLNPTSGLGNMDEQWHTVLGSQAG